MSGAIVSQSVKGWSLRLRGRFGLLLMRPFFRAEVQSCRDHWVAGHQPASYDKDWWPGGFFALQRLRSAMAAGEPSPVYIPDAAAEERGREMRRAQLQTKATASADTSRA